MILNDEDIIKLALSEKILNNLISIPCIKEIFLKKISNFANTNAIKNLENLGINECLSCKKPWWETEGTKPHDAHNFSKALILKPISINNRVLIANKTRPFTVIEKNRINDDIDINDFFEKIKLATTFGGICSNCDNIYNYTFEENENLDFNNEEHLKLFVERASLFKYYRELRMTSIIESFLNLSPNDINRNDWEEYKKYKNYINDLGLIEKRKKIFHKDRVILRKDNIKIKHKVFENYEVKNFMFTDYNEPLDNHISLINLVILKNKSYLIISSENNKNFKKIKKSLQNRIEQLDFKDIIIVKPYSEKIFDLNNIVLNLNHNDDYLYIIINKEVYTKIPQKELNTEIFKDKNILDMIINYTDKKVIIFSKENKDKELILSFDYLIKDRTFNKLEIDDLEKIYKKC